MRVELLDKSGLGEAQALVAEFHYLRKKVDTRSSPLAYGIYAADALAGVLIFGRPEATKVKEKVWDAQREKFVVVKMSDGRERFWYRNYEDVLAGQAEITYWQALNLARVYFKPAYQEGGKFYSSEYLPGFVDRSGRWRSTLAKSAILESLDRVGVDYLLAKPPCFPDEPYELRYCLSYCDTRIHKGTLYREAGFEHCWTNAGGVQTYRKPLRTLRRTEHAFILDASMRSVRSRLYRARRAQPSLWEAAA